MNRSCGNISSANASQAPHWPILANDWLREYAFVVFGVASGSPSVLDWALPSKIQPGVHFVVNRWGVSRDNSY